MRGLWSDPWHADGDFNMIQFSAECGIFRPHRFLVTEVLSGTPVLWFKVPFQDQLRIALLFCWMEYQNRSLSFLF